MGVVGVAGIGAAAVVGSSLAFGSEPKPPLNVRPAEAAVKAKVAEQTPVKSVRCPRGLPALPSIKFACTVTLTGSDQPLLAIVEHRGGKDVVSLRLR